VICWVCSSFSGSALFTLVRARGAGKRQGLLITAGPCRGWAVQFVGVSLSLIMNLFLDGDRGEGNGHLRFRGGGGGASACWLGGLLTAR